MEQGKKYYEVMGLNKNCSAQEIKKAYKNLVKQSVTTNFNFFSLVHTKRANFPPKLGKKNNGIQYPFFFPPRYHPDKNKDGDSSKMLKKITEAYEVLSDEGRRKEYDKTSHLKLATLSASFSSLENFFQDPVANDMFREFCETDTSGTFSKIYRQQNPTKKRKRKNPQFLQTTLKVSFIESAIGGSKLICLLRQELCDSCQGVNMNRLFHFTFVL